MSPSPYIHTWPWDVTSGVEDRARLRARHFEDLCFPFVTLEVLERYTSKGSASSLTSWKQTLSILNIIFYITAIAMISSVDESEERLSTPYFSLYRATFFRGYVSDTDSFLDLSARFVGWKKNVPGDNPHDGWVDPSVTHSYVKYYIRPRNTPAMTRRTRVSHWYEELRGLDIRTYVALSPNCPLIHPSPTV